MFLVLTFLLGVGNFTLHKAVMESGHPLLGEMPWYYHRLSGHFSLGVEFVVLLAALLLANQGLGWVTGAYFGYSLLNLAAAWLILSGRV